ncbi:SDR family oxidoreductase [Zunongwangia sp. H14]|uniref:SDR family oxidoreductase n=1 Tax=Zunongwangia sp. H14 TaxID=3240792 RepID=UPI003563C180
MKFENKIAVVTGASSGIGRAIAKKLSAEGCKVALASRNPEKPEELQQQLPEKSMVVEMDVSLTDSVVSGFKKVNHEMGGIDILVNSAGVMPVTYIKNRHLDEWLQTVEVNLKGCLRCIYSVLPSMKVKKSGHIVNIASVEGKDIYKGGAVYGASKAAVIALSKAMRMELSPEFNIRVTAIAPGNLDISIKKDHPDVGWPETRDKQHEAVINTQQIADAVFKALLPPDMAR